MKKKKISSAVTISLIVLFSISLGATTYQNIQEQLSIQGKALDLPIKKPRIVIKKGERKLYLYSEQKVLRVYNIGLGFEPNGHKAKQGDGKTPEGTYRISLKNPKSQFYLSLAINYPNPNDGKQGLSKGLINQKQYQEILRRNRIKANPPWNTALGGEIFIHGHGSKADWTLGCIALENSEMKELYQSVPVGTEVNIMP